MGFELCLLSIEMLYKIGKKKNNISGSTPQKKSDDH
jgi:hypothetical protein